MDADRVPDRLSRILDEVEGEMPASSDPSAGTASPLAGAPPAGAPLGVGVTSEVSPPPQAAGLGALFGGLGGDGSLLASALPQVLPALLAAMPQKASAPPAAPAPDTGVPAVAAASSPPQGRAASVPLDRHTALLCAVKPYLGAERQATADAVLKLCRLWDALVRAGVTPAMLSGLLGGLGRTDLSPASAGASEAERPPAGGGEGDAYVQ